MQINKILHSALSFWMLLSSTTMAASIRINWANDRTFSHHDSSVSLSSGTAADGDGTLLELGFYTEATTANLFTGEWRVLTHGRMGDSEDQGDGRFNISSMLIGGTFTEPPLGTPLAIRFYDSESLETSRYYNTVSNTDGSWNWVTPTDATPEVSLQAFKDITSVTYEKGGLSAMKTDIPLIPESSTLVLGISALVMILGRRRI
jgi:hypothetical protein